MKQETEKQEFEEYIKSEVNALGDKILAKCQELNQPSCEKMKLFHDRGEEK